MLVQVVLKSGNQLFLGDNDSEFSQRPLIVSEGKTLVGLVGKVVSEYLLSIRSLLAYSHFVL